MVKVYEHIVVNPNPAQAYGGSVAPWTQIHLHSTGNPNSSMANERDFLARNYNNANYTHLVGWNPDTNRAEAWQVMPKGGAWDVGNAVSNNNGWASIEFVEGSIKNQEQFNKAYQVYIELARQLGDEIEADYNLDDGTNTGLMTHNYMSRVGIGSDHTDPLGFLASWGISYDQLKWDMKNKNFNEAPKPNPNPQPNPTQDIEKISIVRWLKLKPTALYWSSSSGAKPFPSWMKKGQAFKVMSTRNHKQSNSNKEYLISNNGTPLGNVLSQDAIAMARVKANATKWGASSGNKALPNWVKGAWFEILKEQGNEYLLGQNGKASGWINKGDTE